MKNSKVVTIVFIAAVVILVVLGFVVNNSNKTPEEKIKVGVMLPLTGPLAEYGEAIKNGMVLAQEKEGGSNLQLVFEDHAYESAQAVSTFYKLRDTDGVDIIINFGDPTSDAVATLLESTDIPFIGLTVSVTSIISATEYSMRGLASPKDFADKVWEQLRSKNLKRIAIIKVENTYLNGLVTALIETKREDEEVVIIDNYLSLGDKDFRTSITKLKANSGQYDALGVYLMSGQIGQFYSQAELYSLSLPTFGTDFFENQSDIDAAGPAINGAFFVNHDSSEAFKKEYEERFKSVSQISFAGTGYDLITMLRDVDHGDKDSIFNRLASPRNFKGVMGKYAFEDTGTDRYLTSPVVIKTIENGQILTLE